MNSYLQIKNRKITFGKAGELAGSVRGRALDASKALRMNVKMRLGDPEAVSVHRRGGIVTKALISAFRRGNTREENERLNRELAEYFAGNDCLTSNIGFEASYGGEEPVCEDWLMVSYRCPYESHWYTAMFTENRFTGLLMSACDEFGLNGFIYFHYKRLVCYHKDCVRPWHTERFASAALQDFKSLFG
ncbi:hypothetical protein IJT93_07330 [bacterium]|nr:hypothetical protein [bacterium]